VTRAEPGRLPPAEPERRKQEAGSTHVVHVLAQQVLQRLPHGVALGHDALAAVVARAGRVGHQGGAADDALQALLQGGPEPGLAEGQRVEDDLVLEGEETTRSDTWARARPREPREPREPEDHENHENLRTTRTTRTTRTMRT